MVIDLLREEMDRVDDALVTAFQWRMDVALEIAKYKKEQGLPVLDPTREQAVIQRLMAQCKPAMRQHVKRLYEELFQMSRQYQKEYLEGE